MLQRLRTNWRAWPFFGLVTGLAAMAGMILILTYEYKHVIVTKTIDGTEVRIRHGVDAWGPDAFIIVGICTALAFIGVIVWMISRNLLEVWQTFLGLIAAFVLGAVFGIWLWDRITDAQFNAQEAWLGAGCVAVLVAAVLANHLFYHDRN